MAQSLLLYFPGGTGWELSPMAEKGEWRVASVCWMTHGTTTTLGPTRDREKGPFLFLSSLLLPLGKVESSSCEVS